MKWILETFDGKKYKLSDTQKSEIERFLEMDMEVLAMPDDSYINRKSIKVIEEHSANSKRNNSDYNLGNEKPDSYFLPEPKRSGEYEVISKIIAKMRKEKPYLKNS